MCIAEIHCLDQIKHQKYIDLKWWALCNDGSAFYSVRKRTTKKNLTVQITCQNKDKTKHIPHTNADIKTDISKSMWERLTHSLWDALRRQQKSFKSGAPAEPMKQWKFQKLMSFLYPYMANTSRQGNLQEDGDKDETQPQKLLETLPSSAAEAPKSPKRFKKDDVTALLKQSMTKREERAKARVKERKKLLQEFKPTESDPLFHFFMSMYQCTKRMPPSYQHIVRNRVFNAVSDVEAELLEIPGQQQHYYQSISPAPASSNSTTPHSHSENSLLNSSDAHEEEENSTTTSAVNLINYINNFSQI
ncbi:hypothetical protein RI129_003526 [Pyrocoelia pectoralis]|uniref:BESS domain-containing protein n=1 Tax=Pyrocoelia pectoralis TaxID=417401 RepID=A0AAN7VRZ8_9COLE